MGMGGGLEALAAEYVLGTLEPEERAQVEARIAEDPEFAALVASWQERFAPLAIRTPSVTPSADLKDALMARLDAIEPPLKIPSSDPVSHELADMASIDRLRRQVVRWRMAAVLALTVAAGFLVLWLRAQGMGVEEDGRFIAALEGEGGGGPAFVALVDLNESVVYIKAVGAQPAGPTESYELWAVGGGRRTAQSLGVIGRFQRLPAERVGDLTARALAETRFAVSREPIGGSPTGQPTGDVPFIGKLVAIKP